MPPISNRRLPIGAEVDADGVSFRLWAPARERCFLVIEGNSEHEMMAEDSGYFWLYVPGLTAGARYQFHFGDASDLLADPASRFQPDGPSGSSVVVDPTRYPWNDHDWQGMSAFGTTLYEMHIGTFTRDGSFASAREKLAKLRMIGINCLEVMPINEFEGEFGWGYDGTLLYAPTRLYGPPDDVRAFVDEAHRLGMGVILDVVYNHFGSGERFCEFTPEYFTERYSNEWGKSINFDGPNSRGVREYVAKNAAYWIDEFHFDGLRIDATQALFDSSREHIVTLIAREARAAAGQRQIYLVSENEPQQTSMVRPVEVGGHGLDALWNDDFHRSATVALTGRSEAYYHDHRGSAQELVSAAKYGYLFQGQRYDWQDRPRGTPGLDLEPWHFIHFLQNHDQVANSGTGARIGHMTSPARLRALTALQLLGPQTPMLFQGQEFGSSSPFYYFADHDGEIADIVRQGRRDFISQFPNLRDEKLVEHMADPCARATFDEAKLDWAEWERNAAIVRFHRDLLHLRQTDKAFSRQACARDGQMDGSILSSTALLLRFFAEKPSDERLLLINFGNDIVVDSLPDPLFAPPGGHHWHLSWSSEEAAYGGSGRRCYDFHKPWVLNGDIALVLAPAKFQNQQNVSTMPLEEWQAGISRVGGSGT
ncbi:malto-oligosyltrehalose trehalohydrolase [Rhizobium binae]|nr:malto-oligosyltrehalose trehalohydrolase [Rhizobium binae]NKL49796.1 malto-oligosyltrehalose trehalohydrolase [Rhizobium leguminosarum bv. viciae]MBX4926980.1 malto-oligosyltrehalose trehalohydrolase [Rhizobium binae]MBX4938760.1 malto-oligosyltrehalose trehalohydrolase [Rhizobium binae]MBX4945387.1 malto-oligosyltrehalose trehalohydrolase [Rhizobium binae]MBX4963616.1 malto-oligosyltrehalose trehalohydrolase [Rhizobium binae]